MATQRLTMHQNREVLRQKALGQTNREIATSVGISPASVSNIVTAAKAAGVTWEAAQELGDEELEAVFYDAPGGARTTRPLPDFPKVHTERRRPGVTLALLHEEYLKENAEGYRYTQFCELYREWVKRRGWTMRIEHVAGERAFVDYSGKKLYLVDRETGECVEVELFVGVLGASNYTFADVTLTQRGPDFLASHMRMLEYFGGVPAAIVPDQLKSAVTRSCWYDPKIQRTYAALAEHYGTTVMPARPRRPRDKAKVEVAVQIAQRWILARLRNEVYHTLEALRARVLELLAELNERPMKKYGGVSRRELFERIERGELRRLPIERFEYCEWKQCRVNIDYHVDVDKHFYSVPHELIHETVEARFTASTVELLHRGKRVASHARSHVKGKHTTVTAHMPAAHQKHREWTPSRLIDWAKKTGPNAAALVEAILKERRHPEQGYRSCLGILRLGKSYGDERLEAACARALALSARSYRHVKSILETSLDRAPAPEATAEPTTEQTAAHEHVRGARYYN